MSLWKKYLITIGAALTAVLVIICVKDVFNQTSPAQVLQILCDAFFAIGIIVTGFGLLVFSSNEGVFDGLLYGVGSFIDFFRTTGKRKYPTLYDYKQSRGEKKLSFGYIVFSGLGFIAVSLILLIFYHQYK